MAGLIKNLRTNHHHNCPVDTRAHRAWGCQDLNTKKYVSWDVFYQGNCGAYRLEICLFCYVSVCVCGIATHNGITCISVTRSLAWVLKAIFCTLTCLFFIIIHLIHKWRRRNYSFVFRLTIPTSLTFKQEFFWILFVLTRLVRMISLKTKEWLLSCHLWIRSIGDDLRSCIPQKSIEFYPLYVLKVLSDVYTNEHVRKCVDLTTFAALFDIRDL